MYIFYTLYVTNYNFIFQKITFTQIISGFKQLRKV